MLVWLLDEPFRPGRLARLEIHRVTAGFSRAETSGLTSQIRRASASICANLAEGGRE
jgi:four helix bundle protein